MKSSDILPASAEGKRQQEIESLYIINFEYIRDLIFSDPAMTLEAEQQIINGLAANLGSYDGKFTNEGFRAWVTEIITPVVGFHAIRRVCEPFVRAAIWKTLQHHLEPSKFDDYPELVRELEQEVWCWVYQHQAELREPGTARITTRVYERAVVMTRGWLKKQRGRRASVIRCVYKLPSKKKMSEAAAKRFAAQLDVEARQAKDRHAAEQAEKKEIVAAMKINGLAA